MHDLKAMCEKSITRKKIDEMIKLRGYHQSMFTLDCALASKQFKDYAKCMKCYINDDPHCFIEMVIALRNANAYMWEAFYIARIEYQFNTRLIEYANDIAVKMPLDEIGKTLIDLSRCGKRLEYLLNKGYKVPNIPGTDYDLGWLTKR